MQIRPNYANLVVLERSNNPSLSIRHACKKVAARVGIKEETVRRAYSRAQKLKERDHGNQLLTDIQEQALVALCTA